MVIPRSDQLIINLLCKHSWKRSLSIPYLAALPRTSFSHVVRVDVSIPVHVEVGVGSARASEIGVFFLKLLYDFLLDSPVVGVIVNRIFTF